MFKAILLEKDDAGFRAGVREVDEAGLPEGDVDVGIAHSTLNFKDGLAITNRGPVVRSWPMVAGIDGAGTVLASSHPDGSPATASCTTAGVSARRGGAVLPSGHA